MSQVCLHFDCDPCLWEEFGEGIIGEGEMFAAIDQSRLSNEIRKQAYCAFVLTWKGHQGKGR